MKSRKRSPQPDLHDADLGYDQAALDKLLAGLSYSQELLLEQFADDSAVADLISGLGTGQDAYLRALAGEAPKPKRKRRTRRKRPQLPLDGDVTIEL